MRSPLEALLADAALEGRISWQEVERSLDAQQVAPGAARALDCYMRLGGRVVGLDYFSGRLLDAMQRGCGL